MPEHERCPEHGILDCSPLLNGCNWPQVLERIRNEERELVLRPLIDRWSGDASSWPLDPRKVVDHLRGLLGDVVSSTPEAKVADDEAVK